jgi:hypothetical protein
MTRICCSLDEFSPENGNTMAHSSSVELEEELEVDP